MKKFIENGSVVGFFIWVGRIKDCVVIGKVLIFREDI